MLLSICIPTYNRSKDLVNNLKAIDCYIQALDEEKNVDIYVVDNCSTDDTYECINNLLLSIRGLHYIQNDTNIGAPKNLVKAFDVSDSEYFMTLGDDDYITEEYLEEVLQIIREKTPIMILGNFVGIDGEGKQLFHSRDPIGETVKSDDYTQKVLWGPELAHQLSGLVFKRTVLSEKIYESLNTTMYPQVYLTMQLAHEGEYYHILKNPIKVTQTNSKDWSYDISGFLYDLLSGFYYLPISKKEKARLEILALNSPKVTDGRLLLNYKHPIKMLTSLFREKRIENKTKRYFVFQYTRELSKIYVRKIKNRIKRIVR